MTFVGPVLEGDRLALARLLTHIENDTLTGRETLSDLFPQTGRAHLVGITGAPGTGKSSLVNQLARYYRHPNQLGKDPIEEAARRVGIVAVDPSSPFTGGAILGDRVRMRDLAGDPGIFIRSMASRGSIGGLAQATAGFVQALDAAGYDVILIETVGAGQAEVDIARLAHTTLVIEAPGLGDDIQALKAGILEIADILVVNKSDRPGAEATERALKGMLQMAHPVQRLKASHHDANEAQETGAALWIPPVLKTIATEGRGIAELARTIDAHFQYLRKTGEWQNRERERLQSELDLLLRDSLVRRWRERISDSQYQEVIKNLVKREVSPWQAVQHLLGEGHP